MTSPQHDTIPVYRYADNCDHPVPAENVPDWDEWIDFHPYSDDGEERICQLTPLDRTYCPACTQEARDRDDLPVDEYTSCRKRT